MHFQYFAQLFAILTFCRNVSYSAGLVFFTTKLQLRVRGYELSEDWWNTVVLGRMYRSILSSCWGIEGQYWLTSGAKRRRRPVLPLNSEGHTMWIHYNVNTVVLGQIYWWILSSFWGIERQYWLTSGAKRRRRPVLPLNSEAWWLMSVRLWNFKDGGS